MTGISVTIGADASGLEREIKKAKEQVSDLESELKNGGSQATKWGTMLSNAASSASSSLIKASAKASKGIQQLIKKAKDEISQLGPQLRDSAIEIGKFGAAATAAGAATTAYLVKSSIDASRELERMRQLANATSTEFQKGAFAVKSVGMGTDKYSDILKDVNDKVGDFLTTGQGPMVDFFEQIAPKVGVTAQQFKNLSGPQALQLYVSSLEKANLTQAETTFYMEALASDSTALLPLLRDGGKAFEEQAKQAENLGLVLSDIDLAQMREAEAAFSRVSTVIGSATDQLAADLSPVLTAISNQFLEAAADSGALGKGSSKAFEYIVKGASFVIDVIDSIGRVFKISGRVIAIGAASIVQRMLEIANGIVMGPIKAFNELTSLANEKLGFKFDLVEPPNIALAMQDQIELSKKIAEEGKKEIAEIMAQPLAGSGIGGFAEFAAEAVEQGEAQARHEVEMEALRKRNEEKLQIQKEAQAAQQELQSQGLLAMYEQDQARIKQTEDNADRMTKARTEGEANMWNDLTGLMSAGSKKMFNVGKAASISQAIVDGYSAAVTAFDNGMAAGGPFGGPALAAAYAAASLAKTGALISSLKSTSYGGGGGGGGGGGSTATPTAQATPPPNTFNVSVNGLNPNQMFSGGQFGDIIGLINDRLRAGDRLVGISA